MQHFHLVKRKRTKKKRKKGGRWPGEEKQEGESEI